MNYAKTIDDFINKYGSPFKLLKNLQSFYGVLSLKKNHQNKNANQVNRGGLAFDSDYILQYSNMINEINIGDKIFMNNKTFIIKTVDKFYLSGQPIYKIAYLSELYS